MTRVELPFGNLLTSFVEADLRSIGIALGDFFQLRCRDHSAKVLFGRGFGDVPVGDWVAFRSAQGPLTIARNFANAAERPGAGRETVCSCPSGDEGILRTFKPTEGRAMARLKEFGSFWRFEIFALPPTFT